LIREYRDVFTWSYDDLKAYKENIIQHTIPLKEGTNPLRQKLRKMNPKILPLVKRDLKKLLIAKIIAPTRHLSWLANLVIVRKKSGEIRLCVYFRNLIQLSLKDNYPFLNMENMLQQVTGANMLSMLDGFSRYNQILVREEYRSKKKKFTPWGTYEYLTIPFGLINVGSTFQRDIDYALKYLIEKIIEIYQDDLTVFSKKKKDHIQHLKQFFDICGKFRISLNPKKFVFGVDEGKLLGHIISKGGVKIDPTRVESIWSIILPKNKKVV
jgi:hypothetical protein